MAAADILQEEPMPVILDDTFAFYDEKRLKSALKWLRGRKRQVIILSCNKREEEILNNSEEVDEKDGFFIITVPFGEEDMYEDNIAKESADDY